MKKNEITIDGTVYVPKKDTKLAGRSTKDFEVGDEIFIRTVTYHYTGRVVDVSKNFVYLEECAWIADSGRFTEFVRDEGDPSEAEVYGDKVVAVSISAIVDFCPRSLVDKQI